MTSWRRRFFSIEVDKLKRGRFAPTPSGPMHLGNALAALLAWLQIRQEDGQIVLRIEDIDLQRSRREYVELIIADLKWLGLDWEEGPDIGGPYGPYLQSQRMDQYEAVLGQLEQADLLYPCYCSRAEMIAIASAPHELGVVYPGTCRTLSANEREHKKQFKNPSTRFLAEKKEIVFSDLALGEQVFPPGYGGDFIVKRADGMFSYQLAVVVDDVQMGITDVLRGRDLLHSTPRQLMLYQVLGVKPPHYTHIPLVHGPDGERLAKRHGSIALHDLRQLGTSPQSIIGLLAFLCGWTETWEPLQAKELIGCFQPAQLPQESFRLSEEMLRTLTT